MNDHIRSQLTTGSDTLGLELTSLQIEKLINYILVLDKWNKVYNLTALRTNQEVITHHLLDCLSIILPFERLTASQSSLECDSLNILDVGSGAGLPGVVMAICFPQHIIHCVDAVAKKVAFVKQVASSLDLKNLTAFHTRVENIKGKYSVITSRAFASLTDFVSCSANVLTLNGVWMAMKGKLPLNEIEQLPANIDMFHVEHIDVPGLNAERCIVWMQKRKEVN